MVLSRENPQQLRAKERVDLVLRTAKDILAERGYSGLTLSAVCERAKIKQTSIYRYWPNQTALLVSLISFFEEDYQLRIKLLEEAAFDLPWREVQHILLKGLGQYSNENPWVYAGLAAVRGDPGVAARHQQTLEFFATRYAHLLKIGGFGVRGEEEARISFTYVLLLDSFLFAYGRVGNFKEKQTEVIESFYEVVTSYLAPYMQSNDDPTLIAVS
ncbi:TetR/AcrR family transcriptional regulator [Alphaproteobacteria bacterium]|nr:TetR/AcrR family transcriptional regulator [Alphaproteobacteria bacterium]